MPARGSRLVAFVLACLAIAGVACSSPSPAATATPSPAVIPLSPPAPVPVTSTATARPRAAPAPTRTPQTPQAPTPRARLISTPISAHAIPEGARYGGTLNLASREGILHQDVHLEVSPALSMWGPGIAYSRLLRLRSGPEVELPSLAVECDLCQGWQMEDETTFIFQLRNDVRWQDTPPVDGRPLTAEDVVFSYDRQREPQSPNAPLLRAIASLDALRPGEVRVSLAAPDADFMASLADGHSKIVAREAVEAGGDLRQGPTIGTGPWTLTSTAPNGPHAFEASADYFEEGLPFLGGLKIHVIPDAVTREAAFRVNAIDVYQMEPEQWLEFHEERPDAPFVLSPDAGTGLEVGLKASESPFDDVDVRRAVFLAMDPWEAIEEVWLGFAFVSLGFPVAEADWLLPKEELEPFFGDVDAARALLAESALSVSISVGDFGDRYMAHARRIADEMEAVGFEPTLEVVNRRVFGEDVWLGGDYQMFVGPPAPASTPSGYLLPVLHSQGPWNTADVRDTELDRLLETQAREYDAAARRELVRDLQRRMLGLAYRFMPATGKSIWSWSPRVRNLHPNFAASEYLHWARVWVEE